MILPAFPAVRVSGVVLLRGWLASIPIRLTVPLPLVVPVLPLRLTNLLASVLITARVILFPLVFIHAVPHLLELVQSMLSSVGAFYAISSGSRRI